MEFVMPAFACIVVVFGLIKKVPVFDVFISGAKEGVKLLYNIAPTIMCLPLTFCSQAEQLTQYAH
jgi:spore maturation protein B